MMTGRELIQQFFTGGTGSRPGLWLGNPHADTVKLYCEHFGTPDFETIRQRFGDDCRWFMADQFYRGSGSDEDWTIFDYYGGEKKHSHGQAGVFAECSSVSEVEDFDWPDPRSFDFGSLKEKLTANREYMRFSGMWSPFFHDLMGFFGMENYMIKMHTDPEVVEAVTDHVVDFYLKANETCFQECGEEIDAFFFGNDFGSQQDLLISPKMFDRFVLPYFRKLVALAKDFDLPVMLHSCGAISRVIPALLDAGVDALHPLQARAAGMEAERLARKFRGRVTFVGGVDTQELLVNASAREVRREVERLQELFGPRFIVSPSHEALLPNVPPGNMVAMAEVVHDREFTV